VETPWKFVSGYIFGLYRVSHPKVVPPIKGEPPRPANMEIQNEKARAKDTLDTLQLIMTVRTVVVDGM
jgi:hypothetical protein